MSNYIRKVKYNNHPSLGNLEFDLCKDDKPFNTIVFAGENGCGKTTILSTIYSFLNKGTFENFSYLNYTIDNIVFELLPPQNGKLLWSHTRRKCDTGEERNIESNYNFNGNEINSDKCDLRHYGCIYSTSRSGFNTKHIKSTTTLDIDRDKYVSDADDDFTNIKQLLIDIDNFDSSDGKRYCQTHRGAHDISKEFELSSRVHRFKQAFNNFFDGKIEYIGSKAKDGNELELYFTKNGKEVFLNDLSTGEKQIVFRGAMLLRNRDNLYGSFVFIDEPELSMHPRWQKKILKFYRDLFTKDEEQTVQMFIATHSEYVLEGALEDKDNVLLIYLKDNAGEVESRQITSPLILPETLASEIKYKVFGIPNIDYYNALFDYFQTKNGLKSVVDVDKAIMDHDEYDPQKHAKSSSHGSTQYKTLPTYIRNRIHHPGGHQCQTDEFMIALELLEKMVAP